MTDHMEHAGDPCNLYEVDPRHKARVEQNVKLRQKILDGAIVLAAGGGLQCFTRDGVALVADVAAGHINRHFGTISNLRQEVVKEAIRVENLDVLAQGITAGFEPARRAPHRLKTRALALAGAR